MTEFERDQAFKAKLPQLVNCMKELVELADLRFQNEISYLCVTFGKHGHITEDIKDLCKKYGVKTDF